jgi:hypothetical protein
MDSKENLGSRRGADSEEPQALIGVLVCSEERNCCGFGRGPRGPAQRGGVEVDEEGVGDVVAVMIVSSVDAEVRTEFKDDCVLSFEFDLDCCCCCFCWSLAKSTLILATSDSSLFSLVHAARSLSSTAVCRESRRACSACHKAGTILLRRVPPTSSLGEMGE